VTAEQHISWTVAAGSVAKAGIALLVWLVITVRLHRALSTMHAGLSGRGLVLFVLWMAGWAYVSMVHLPAIRASEQDLEN
jgi:hypothetical protein